LQRFVGDAVALMPDFATGFDAEVIGDRLRKQQIQRAIRAATELQADFDAFVIGTGAAEPVAFDRIVGRGRRGRGTGCIGTGRRGADQHGTDQGRREQRDA
jgi:hypothetical protein